MSSNVNQRHILRTSRLALALCAALACVAVAACGSSKGSAGTAARPSASTSGSTSSTGASGASGASGPAGPVGRFSALRECLAKNGVTLPHPPGGRGGPGAFFLGAGPRAPRAFAPAKRAQLQAAMKKCGAPGRLRFGPRFRRFGPNPLSNSPAFKQALTKYAACLRANGVTVPTPNFSGNGPVFDTAHINTAGARFRNAQIKCRGVLRASGL
jgi:hypothetical protein